MPTLSAFSRSGILVVIVHLFAASTAGFILLCPASAQSSDAIQPPQFETDVLPILKTRCIKCHGSDAREGGLRLTSHRDLIHPNDSGIPAVIPGDSSHSELVRRITAVEDDVRMPPKGEKLSDTEVQTLLDWIDSGAAWPNDSETPPQHWAYRKPIRPEIADNTVHPIDYFAARMLSQHGSGLSLSPRELPARLLRRVYLDLIGLPPSPAEVEAFNADPSASHFAEIVDGLLASPRYGEKWARQWLDLARYADSNGYQADQFRSVWAYRDWVINAFNADMPFDQFTIEQLAGDLLPDATVEQKLATGFHRLTTCNVEAGVDPEENRTNQVADRVNTTATVWLGTTLECARCHNHKYDPFTQQDYYQLFAFFNNTPIEVEQTGEGVQFEVAGPVLELPVSEERRSTAARLQSDLVEARQARNQHTAKPNLPKTDADTVLKELNRKIEVLEQQLKQAQPPTSAVMTELSQARPSFIMKRGDFLSPGMHVDPATPTVLHELQREATTDSIPNRLDLARWIVSPENPLTARVTVNRWWAEFFGRGIVSTQEDFGTQSSPPSHPQLLDWLATELIENGWSMKHIHRQIVLSAVYQQSSLIHAGQLEADPFNRLLARGPRFRLSAETIRDNALAISGLLSTKMGGPPVYPPQPENIWRHVGRNAPIYQTDADEDRFRRGIYVVWRRSAPYPSFVNFDAPDRASCVVGRSRSNTPLQALTLMNDPAYVEMALSLAARIVADQPDRDVRTRITYAFRLCVARTPQAEEVDTVQSLWTQELERFTADEQQAEKLIAHDRRQTHISIAEQAAWFSVANVLLNLDETITRN
ncbi:MAG: PSD1 and planctomycete cytochrome C domain-containing protein [Planctomycetaceae bacterium]